MSLVFWAVVGLSILAAVTFIRWLLVAKTHGLSELKAGDRINLIINAVMFVLTVISIAIALAAFHDSKTSGDEQKKALDSSRQSLQEVVSALQTQTALLNDAQNTLRSQLEVSRQQQKAMTATNNVLQSSGHILKSQLKIATEQNKRELERLNKKPRIHFSLGMRPENFLSVTSFPEESFSVGSSINIKGAHYLTLTVSNIGNADLDRPILAIRVRPMQVGVFMVGYNRLPDSSGVMYSCGIKMPESLEPTSKVMGGYSCDFGLNIPDSISSLTLTFEIHGSNMPIHESAITLTVFKPEEVK